jgi:RNase adaptor protein for sRNA GlmZ degradation
MLILNLYSFSYIKTPRDSITVPHGGGFEFDCRCLPNPGREAQFRAKTGLDSDVAETLTGNSIVETFLNLTFSTIELALKAYASKGYSDLAVGYGCTGGQHRSVYCTERCLKHFENFQLETAKPETADPVSVGIITVCKNHYQLHPVTGAVVGLVSYDNLTS